MVGSIDLQITVLKQSYRQDKNSGASKCVSPSFLCPLTLSHKSEIFQQKQKLILIIFKFQFTLNIYEENNKIFNFITLYRRNLDKPDRESTSCPSMPQQFHLSNVHSGCNQCKQCCIIKSGMQPTHNYYNLMTMSSQWYPYKRTQQNHIHRSYIIMFSV